MPSNTENIDRQAEFMSWIRGPRAYGANIHEEMARAINNDGLRGHTEFAAHYDDAGWDIQRFSNPEISHAPDLMVIDYADTIRRGAQINIRKDRSSGSGFVNMEVSFNFGYFEESIHSLDGCKKGGCIICQNATPKEGPPVTKFELMRNDDE